MNIFITHTITIGLTVLLIILMIFSVNHLSSQWKEFVLDSESENVCLNIKKAVFDVFIDTENNAGETELNLPAKIAGSEYMITTVENDIGISRLNTTRYCSIGINAKFSADLKGGLVIVRHNRIGAEDVVVFERD